MATLMEILKKTPKEPTAEELVYRSVVPCQIVELPISGKTLLDNYTGAASRKWREEMMAMLDPQNPNYGKS
jgi:hypothetical protein